MCEEYLMIVIGLLSLLTCCLFKIYFQLQLFQQIKDTSLQVQVDIDYSL